ncbi:MAG: hypothetical protein DWQ34_15410 [Planctomycetota bacterium]|nr:MAG: hypothetical protein DWQ34_15410 [Planctomycetota bacterium]REJ91277.1 MAG: hypothetical protein DWQ29_05845 [Planctomycetota bacterium]REK28897.1 MAG: hypothetical protein DWQ41_04920 [Planctomycetota bacterium]REK39669.1 MAG: hypothetical protein DWQ45_02025 [Planctomycetota bacterium]
MNKSTENKHGVFRSKWFLELIALCISIVGPWMDRLGELGLISSYFRPQIEWIALILSAAVFLTTLGRFRGVPALAPKKRCCIISLVILILSIVACLFLSSTLGVTFDPGKVWTEMLWLIWQAFYCSAAGSLAGLLAVLGLLLAKN